MIANPRVFTDDHLPRELKHREGEVDAFSTAVKPATHGDRAGDVLLSGSSGVGKTTLARHTLSRLDEHADVVNTYVTCLGKTPTGILREVIRGYPGAPSVPDNSRRDRLQRIARDTFSRPFVVVLDEAGDVPETGTLELLTSLPYVSIVAICHDADRWLATAGSDIRSRIAVHIEPDRFTVEELADILEPRATHGLVGDVVTRDQLRDIADEVAGVAREGIQALGAAAELSEERGHESITDEDIADSYQHARRRIRESNLASLPFHHQVLFHLIQEDGSVDAATLHERYDRVSDSLYHGEALSPIGKRSRRYKLSKLEDYGLIVTSDDANPVYSVVDTDLTSPIQFDILDA